MCAKRELESSKAQVDGKSNKKAKVHPFFDLVGRRNLESKFWRPNINKTCLYGVQGLFLHSSKIAVFDLDHTLVVPKGGKRFPSPTDPSDWQWWRAEVPLKLRALCQDGFSLFIVSNQSRLTDKTLRVWRQKIELIGEAIPDLPFCIIAATGSNEYRKPMPGMWFVIEDQASADGFIIDKEVSFFVGDAAGRRGDHSASDRMWASNAGLKFYTPEEYFLGTPPAEVVRKYFDPSSIPVNLPLLVPSSSPLLPTEDNLEIVVFVGYPGVGKSTFYRRYFQPRGYVHVNQDTVKSRGNCLKLTAKSLENGQSCVIDNTNRDVQTRKLYIDLARKHNCVIRCFIFTSSIDLAWHNILFRTWINIPTGSSHVNRDFVPKSALHKFQAEYQEPRLEEGFSEIRSVNWLFEGSEEDRKRWRMFLDL